MKLRAAKIVTVGPDFSELTIDLHTEGSGLTADHVEVAIAHLDLLRGQFREAETMSALQCGTLPSPRP